MATNTKEDFLGTMNPGSTPIICPACGAELTLRNKSLFSIVLTTNARKEFNDIIRSYRSFIEQNDSELQLRNRLGAQRSLDGDQASYPYSTWSNLDAYGCVIGPGADSVEKFCSAPDLLGVSAHIRALPALNDLDADKLDEKQFRNLYETLVRGAEPHPVIGMMMDVLFEQEDVSQWIIDLNLSLKTLNEDRPSGADSRNEPVGAAAIKSVLQETAPGYHAYLEILVKYLRRIEEERIRVGANASVEQRRRETSKSRTAEERTLALIYSLALLTGHRYSDFGRGRENRRVPGIPVLSLGQPYDLPSRVMIPQPLLGRLLRSRVLVDRRGLNWSEEIRKLLLDVRTERATAVDHPVGAPASDQPRVHLEQLEEDLGKLLQAKPFLKEDVKRFVEFECLGRPPSVLRVDEDRVEEVEVSHCGWSPKEEPTYPVIFLGGRGSGKSTVMMSGLTTFSLSAGAMGLDIRASTAHDLDLLSAYQHSFFAGLMPEATEAHKRYSVQLTVLRADEPRSRMNVIYTDIPGEMVERSIGWKDTDPSILSLLKYTNVICFFYDLSLEPSIYEMITRGASKDMWHEIVEQATALHQRGRGKKRQIDILRKLIEDMRELRNDADIKENVTFVCVIPKADYYVGAESEGRFFNKLLSTLRERGILTESQLVSEDAAEELNNYRSMGGAGFRFGPVDAKNRPEQMMKQAQIVRLVHETAKDCLADVGRMFGSDSAYETDRILLRDTVNTSLLQMLEATFRRVYVLPVSAQGMHKKQDDENSRVTLNGSPRQKLAEYIFLLPYLLVAQRESLEGSVPEVGRAGLA